MTDSAPQYKFSLGDPVKKVKGYAFDSVIVSNFINQNGQKRVVAQDERGVMHIFSESQLEPDNRVKRDWPTVVVMYAGEQGEQTLVGYQIWHHGELRGNLMIDHPVYRHKKRGSTYEVLSDSAHLQHPSPDYDNLRMVVYCDQRSRQVYVRSYDEFHDGRFELVTG